MKLNKYFKSEEFECKCGCGYEAVNPELVKVLTDLRIHFGRPVNISSGLRCATYNAKIGGAKKSQHKLGTAADIWVSGVEHSEVQEYLLKTYPGKYGIGLYNTFTHIDVRDYCARWDNR